MLSRSVPRRGVSLVELMVGVTVGLIVILGAMGMYLGTAKGARETVRVNRFNQDLRAALDIVVSDLRRAGYADPSVLGSANPFTAATTDMRISGASRDCILFAYDTTWRSPQNPGLNAGSDFGGFRVSNGAVQALRTAIADTGADCGDLEWEDVTDPRVVRITSLQFDFGGSSCLTADPQSYDPAASSSYTAWTTDSPTAKTGCDPAAPGANAIAAAIPAGNAVAEVRRVTVTLQGQTSSGENLARKPLVETVLVRNHRVMLP